MKRLERWWGYLVWSWAYLRGHWAWRFEAEPVHVDVPLTQLSRPYRAKRIPAHELAHGHVPRLVEVEEVLLQVHGSHPLGRFNAWLAVQITGKVGTMWAAYLFALIGITALVGALSGNLGLTLVVGGFSSYFLQLVLLPVIMVGQNVQQAASDARAEADHQTLSAIHELSKHIDNLQATQLQILEKLPK
jgi:hypothetical protein